MREEREQSILLSKKRRERKKRENGRFLCLQPLYSKPMTRPSTQQTEPFLPLDRTGPKPIPSGPTRAFCLSSFLFSAHPPITAYTPRHLFLSFSCIFKFPLHLICSLCYYYLSASTYLFSRLIIFIFIFLLALI